MSLDMPYEKVYITTINELNVRPELQVRTIDGTTVAAETLPIIDASRQELVIAMVARNTCYSSAVCLFKCINWCGASHLLPHR
mgnify:CR=1 FL=1